MKYDSWEECYPKGTIPTIQDIEKYVESPLLQKLNDYIQTAYKISPKIEYSGCSMQRGWNVKYKKSGKSLCTIYPMKGYFIALVVIGAKEMTEAELLMPFCAEYTQELFNNTKEGQGQKWLMIEAKSEVVIEDIFKLMELRVKPTIKL